MGDGYHGSWRFPQPDPVPHVQHYAQPQAQPYEQGDRQEYPPVVMAMRACSLPGSVTQAM